MLIPPASSSLDGNVKEQHGILNQCQGMSKNAVVFVPGQTEANSVHNTNNNNNYYPYGVSVNQSNNGNTMGWNQLNNLGSYWNVSAYNGQNVGFYGAVHGASAEQKPKRRNKACVVVGIVVACAIVLLGAVFFIVFACRPAPYHYDSLEEEVPSARSFCCVTQRDEARNFFQDHGSVVFNPDATPEAAKWFDLQERDEMLRKLERISEDEDSRGFFEDLEVLMDYSI